VSALQWLFPGFLLGAAAVVVPIVLHLIRRRPKRIVAFPSLRFLASTQPRNENSQRLRRWLVLLMRCLALALIAAAFARPFFNRFAAGERQAVVVVVDNSFSLQAEGRWPALQRWAREQLADLGPGDRLGVLVLSPRPTWVAPLTTPAPQGLETLGRLAPGWGSARAEPALRLAGDALAAAPADRRRMVYLGDHQRVSWAGCDFGKTLPPGVRIAFPGVPEPLARQAALRTPSVTRTAAGFHAVVSIENFTAAQSRRLRVYRDGGSTPVHEQPVALPERDSATLSLDWPASDSAGTAFFHFALDADELPADDQAYAVWQAAGENLVLLDATPREGGADYLGTALAATAALPPTLRVLPLPAEAWPAQAVAVLRNHASFAGENAARLDTFLRAGGSALLFMDDDPAASRWLADHAALHAKPLKSDADALEVRDWAMDHALVAGLATHSVHSLVGWSFHRGWSLPADAVEPLALWPDGGAAIGETSGAAGRLLLCGFAADRRSSEWPARETFVPFVHRAVTYLLGARQVSEKPARVGETLALPAESGTWRAVAGPATGTMVTIADGAVSPAAPGVYEFSHGPGKKLFAVNLAPEESDPAAWTDGTPWEKLESETPAPAMHARAPIDSAEAEARAPLWWWVVAAIGALFIAELGLANRTAR
jgi:hypothetical protein